MFKNVLRTFEAEILKIFKNIQPQPKNWRLYIYKKKSFSKLERMGFKIRYIVQGRIQDLQKRRGEAPRAPKTRAFLGNVGYASPEIFENLSL